MLNLVILLTFRACTMVENMSSLSPPRHLEKTINSNGTIHHLLLSSLVINIIDSNLVRNYIAKGAYVLQWGK
jgi:hypothetical protein